MHQYQKLTIRKLADTIKQMEVDLGLLSEERYGREARLAWETSRFSVMSELRMKYAGHGVAHTQLKKKNEMSLKELFVFGAKLLYNSIKNSWLWAPRRCKWLIIQHPRLRLRDDGFYEDLYTEELVKEIGEKECVCIESPHLRLHYSPTTHQVYYNDFTLLLSYILIPYAWVRQRRSSNEINKMCLLIDRYLAKYLNNEVDIGIIVRNRLNSFFRNKIAYSYMLRVLRPEKIILVCSYVHDATVIAARELSIPVVELQHGFMSEEHLGYSVPFGQKKLAFPDYLWVFGSYWQESVTLSLPENRIQSLGYPYFDRMRDMYGHIQKENKLVFISQGTIGKELSKFAVALAARYCGSQIEMIFKLHPGERERWKSEYSWLKEACDSGAIRVIEADQPNLYELFAVCKWQIGVYSTAIFEGLGLGCKTFLVNLPGIESMESLIVNSYVKLVNGVEEVDFFAKTQVVDSFRFFAQSWQTNLKGLLQQKLTSYI